MKRIRLHDGQYAIVDDDDFERVSELKWRACKGSKNKCWYARTSETICGHRGFTYMHHFVFPGHEELDHKNRNGLDNRKSNLRPATSSQNQANREKRAGTSSRFKGVCWDNTGKKWKARIKCNRKERNLGLYDSEQEAARAYNRAAKEAFGEFAWLNPI